VQVGLRKDTKDLVEFIFISHSMPARPSPNSTLEVKSGILKRISRSGGK
jgi:hypothetical protein